MDRTRGKIGQDRVERSSDVTTQTLLNQGLKPKGVTCGIEKSNYLKGVANGYFERL